MTKLLLEALATIEPVDISTLEADYKPKKLTSAAIDLAKRLFTEALGEALVYELSPIRYDSNREFLCDFEDNEYIYIEFAAAGIPIVVQAVMNYPSSISRSTDGKYIIPDASDVLRWYVEAGECGEFGELANIATTNLKARLLTAIKFAMVNYDSEEEDDD